MSAAKTKAQEIIDGNAVGMLFCYSNPFSYRLPSFSRL